MERLTSPNINVDQGTDRFLHATIGGKEIDWKQNRDSTLNVLINGPTSNGFGKDIFRKMARDLYGRLKAYEDIAELCGGFARLRELAEADKDGRVVVPPCRQGDELWTYCNHPVKRVYSFTVSDVSTLNGRTVLNTLGLGTIRPEDIGKTVFFTREEAEKALQEMEGKKDGCRKNQQT